jgi:hypothetical protein
MKQELDCGLCLHVGTFVHKKGSSFYMRTEQAAIPQTAIGLGAWRVRLAWLLFAIIIILGFTGVALHLRIDRGDLRDSLGLIYMLASAGTGMLIVVRRPTNSIGWLLLGSAFCQTSGFSAAQYGLYSLVTRPDALPFAQTVAWWASIGIPLGAGLTVMLLPLVFPNGRLVSPAWRPFARIAVVTLLVLIAYSAIRPGNIQDIDGLPNPYALALPPPWNSVVDLVTIVAIFGLVLFSAASLIVRYRRSSGDERLQLKWLTYAIVAWFISILLSTIAQQFSAELYVIVDIGVMVVLAMIPLPPVRYRPADQSHAGVRRADRLRRWVVCAAGGWVGRAAPGAG